MSRVDQLIVQLSAEAEPVRRLLPVWARTLTWLVASATTLGLALAWLGLRPDLAERITEPWFLVQIPLALACALSAAWSAFTLAVPGAERRWLTRWLPMAVLAGWAAWMVYRMADFVSDPAVWGEVAAGLSLEEALKGLGIAAVPGLLLLLMVRRGEPLRPGWAGGLAMLAAGSVSFLVDLLSCMSFCPIHAVYLHLIPTLLTGLLGVGVGWLWLRRS